MKMLILNMEKDGEAADLNAKVTRRNRPRINADGPSSRGPKRRDFDFVPGSVSRPADRVDPRAALRADGGTAAFLVYIPSDNPIP